MKARADDKNAPVAMMDIRRHAGTMLAHEYYSPSSPITGIPDATALHHLKLSTG
jgi:hypothetical protein